MCLITVISVLEHWNYPLKNILGETGCHIANLLRQTGSLQIQFHSFIMATTRYIFLFHDNLLLRFNLTANVSAITVYAVLGRDHLSFLRQCTEERVTSFLSGGITYHYVSNKSTGEETGKTHLCAVLWKFELLYFFQPITRQLTSWKSKLWRIWLKQHFYHNGVFWCAGKLDEN